MAQSPSSNHDSSESLFLINKEGKRVELTAEKLDRWFAKVEAETNPPRTSEPADDAAEPQASDSSAPGVQPLLSEEPAKTAQPTGTEHSNEAVETDTFLATQLLSRFGLQSSKDVITFLKSPAGKSVEETIREQLAEIAAMREEQAFQLREQQALRHRIMAFLFLAFLYSRESKAHNLNEQIQKSIDKLLHTETHAKSTDSTVNIAKYIAAYEDIASKIEGRLTARLDEATALEAELAAMEQQGKDITSKYNAYISHLAELEQEHDLISELDLSDPQSKTTLDATKLNLKLKIDTLTEQLDKEVEKISELLDSDDPKDHLLAREKLHLSNARNLQIGSLKDMVAVIQGDSKLYKLNGQPAHSFAEAEFILSKKQILATDGTKQYVLNEGQKLTDLSEADKHQAEKLFHRMRPEMISVKKLVSHNHTMEHGEHNKRKSALEVRSEAMQRDISLLAQQLTAVQAARANAELALRHTSIATPTPHMTPMPSAPTPSARPTTTKPAASSTNYLANTYRHMLLLMKNGPTVESIERLRQGLTGQTLQTESIKLINKLKVGSPIPDLIMQTLLTNIERISGNTMRARGPNAEIAKKRDAPAFNPSPFSMKPPGF